jgi:O-antigen ligase
MMMAFGLRRPFLWVLTYLYIDILVPQKISWFLLASLPVSLIAFIAAFGGWLIVDDKRGGAFTFRQVLILFLLVYCGMTTMSADFPDPALEKWGWVWKALFFAAFLPLTLRTRLRIEAAALFMTLSAGAIIVSAGIKTVLSGGGYGALQSFVPVNSGLYESSTLAMAAIAIIPMIVWHARFGTIFPRSWMVKTFAAALVFACLLVPIGTQARTGLVCIGLLALLSLRTVKRRMVYLAALAAAMAVAVPFLPQSFVARMNTIENHAGDQSASTRLEVWKWTWEYAKDNPFGGGFDAYRGNSVRYVTQSADSTGNNTEIESEIVEDKGRAYHSAYFEMLGEQGWPGLIVWLLLQGLGIWQMERLMRRWRNRTGANEQWQAPLASALQQAQLIYLTGALFIGIAYQPFVLMLIGVQCGLWSYLGRIDSLRLPVNGQGLGPALGKPAVVA